MGRIIGLIACSGMLAAGLWLSGLQQHKPFLAAEQDPAPRSTTLSAPREALRRGKELYLRGKYSEALPLLRQAATVGSTLNSVERLQAEDYLNRTHAKMSGVKGSRQARAQSPETGDEPLSDVGTGTNLSTATAARSEAFAWADVADTEEEEATPQARVIGDEPKDLALNLVKQAREDIRAGRLDEARRKALQAVEVDATYDLFEDRPELLLADIDRLAGTRTSKKTTVAEAKKVTAPKETPKADLNKQAAAKLLVEARQHLKAGRFDAAEAKANEADKLEAGFKLFEDRPELVLNDIAAHQAAMALTEEPEAAPAANNEVATPDKAKSLLAQARKLLSQGKHDEAREMAMEATRLKASYGLFADRPDAVLADIDRAQGRDPSDMVPEGEPVNLNAPNEAVSPKMAADNKRMLASKLLADARVLSEAGQFDEAREKVAEVERLKASFPLLGDRPETVLADVNRAEQAMVAARGAKSNGSVARASALDTNAKATPAIAPWGDDEGDATADMPSVVSPKGLSATELYNRGMHALKKGDRQGAYSSFLAAHQSGEKLDRTRSQRLQQYLRELAPKNGAVQLASRQAEGNDPFAAESGPVKSDDDAKFDRMRTEVVNAVFKAERMRQENPEAALELIDRTMATVEGAELPVEPTASLIASLNKTRAGLQKEIERQSPNLELKRKNSETLAKVKRDTETKIRVEQEFADLVEEFNDLYKQRRFAEAEVIAKRAKDLDPQNPVSETLFWKARFSRRVQSNEDVKLAKEETFIKLLHSVDEAAVADKLADNPIDFGENFADLSRRRKDRYHTLNRVRTEDERRIEQSLDRRISVYETDTPLADVIDKIQEQAGFNIVLDEAGLDEEGASSSMPVTIKLESIKLKNALAIILEKARLSYVIKDDVLHITSRLKAQGELRVETYNVADLVVPITTPVSAPNAGTGLVPQSITPPTMSGAQFSTGVMPGSQPALGQIGPMAGHMGDFGFGTGPRASGSTAPAKYDFDTLTDLITSTIAPDTWAEVNGPATIRKSESTLSLVIRQTQRVHEEIVDLIEQLRRLQDLQVTIEVRFITVSDRFFERIGVDFDFNVQDNAGDPVYDNTGRFLPPFGSVQLPGAGQFGVAGVAGGAGGAAGQAGQAAQAGGGQSFTPGPTRSLVNRDQYRGGGTVIGLGSNTQNSPSFTQDLDVPFRQGSFEIGVPSFGDFRPDAGLQTGFAILSDLEAFFFIQAATADRRTNVVSAPKITLFNGQGGIIQDVIQRVYVAAQQPVVGFNAVATVPIPGRLDDGLTLTIPSVVISSDRRFVRISMTPLFTEFIEFVSFISAGNTGAAGGGGTVGGGQGGAGGIGGAAGGGGGGQFGIGGGAAGGAGGAAGGAAGQAGQQGSTVLGTIQLPVQRVFSVGTTVSVPDGGTVVLGGVKRLREGRNMSGVPILMQIPYVNRLFKNSGTGRETESVLIAVTPRIIIQEEEQELLGIPVE